MINHRIFLILVSIVEVYALTCKDGETMCLNNILRICSPDGYWLEAECPSGYMCNKNKDAISCSRKGKKNKEPDTNDRQKKKPDDETTEESDSIEIEPSMSKDLRKAKSKNRTRTVTVTKKRRKEAKQKSTSDETTGTSIPRKAPKEFQFEFTSPGQPGVNPTVYSIVFQRLPNSDNIFQQAPGPTPLGQQNMNQGVSGGVNSNQGAGNAMSSGQPGIGPAGSPSPASGTPSASPAPGSSPTTPSASPAPGSSPTTPSASPAPGSSPTTPSSGTPSAATPPEASPSAPASTPTSGTPSAAAPSDASSPAPASAPSASPSAPASSPAPASTPSPAPASTPSPGTDSKPKDSSPSAGKDSSSSSGGSGQMITAEKLSAAMKASGFSANQKYVEAMVKGVNSKYKDKDMVAMMLAQFAHESGGFIYLEEIACKSGCPGQYGTGAPGKSYHGRGFIQLSWPDNYKKASQALGMGDKLYTNPEQVATDVDIAVKTSFWFWDTNVAKAPGVSEKKFGATTKAINGALECKGSNVDKSKKRYAIYKNVAKEMGITNLASESGCY